MTAANLSSLTATRLSTLRRCPRQHFYRYELRLSRIRTSDALRFGAAFHAGLAAKDKGQDAAIEIATAGYGVCPNWADPVDWAVEHDTLRHLLAGYFWRYASDDLEFLAVERTFEMPLVNPETGRANRTFRLAGKIDALVRLPDGRFAVLEYKTAGEDISTGSDYWLRLRCDSQVSQYVLGARALGYDTATVIYDAVRKPTIRPRKNESPQQYGERLTSDIGERPDYYFARREVPRLEDELAEFQLELWQQADQLRESQHRGRWFRNVGRMTCGFCEFSDLCLNSIRVNPDAAPAGYEFLPNAHPELSTGGDV